MSSKRQSILIVHTDEDALIGLERELETSNFTTSTTWDATEAERLLSSSSFDVIVIGDRPPLVSADALMAASPKPPAKTRFIVLPSNAAFMSACLERVRSEDCLKATA